MAVDYEWRLRVLMAENGMFRAIDLAPRLAEHGIRLSDSQVWRLVTGRPERLNLRLLVVLCEILGCEPGEPGELCGSCDVKLGGTTGVCKACGQIAPLIKGACAACRLRARVDQLAAGAGREIAETLAPFLRDLAGAENPSSTLRWFYTPGFEITRRLLAGEIPISHAGLDETAVDAPNPVAFIRAKLVASGVLDSRDEASARFAAWHAMAVLRIAPGTDRGHVRAYATWQVAHQLARTVRRRGEASQPSARYARSLVSEAIKLVVWLHDQELELADLRQDLIDEWIAAATNSYCGPGPTTTG